MSEPEIQTVSSAVVYRNRWMSVREDGIRRTDGPDGVYGVVDKPDFALIVPYYDGGFQLVEQYRYPVRGRYWEFPQGSWTDSPEADPLALAAGELAEETGLIAAQLTRLGFLHSAYGYSSQGCHVVLATELRPGPTKLDPEEAGLISRWFSPDEVWRLVETGRLRDAASIAALALFERHRR